MGIIEELASLRASVESLSRAVGRHSRVPEQRWGVVTTCTTTDTRVTFPGESGEAIITRSTEAVWVGAQVLVQVQGSDRWIVGLGGAALPAGVSAMFSGVLANVPAGWLVKDGRAVPRSTYWRLFNALGGTSSPHGFPDMYGFYLPNQMGRVALGTGTAAGAAGATDHTLGQKGGEETHALTAAENGPHWHNVGLTQNDDGTADVLALQETSTVNYGGWAFTLQSTGGGYRKFIADTGNSVGTAHNNLPPYLAEIPIIKF